MKKKQASKKNAAPAKSIKVTAASKPSPKPASTKKAITGTSTRKPTLSDIAKIQAIELDDLPDRYNQSYCRIPGTNTPSFWLNLM